MIKEKTFDPQGKGEREKVSKDQDVWRNLLWMDEPKPELLKTSEQKTCLPKSKSKFQEKKSIPRYSDTHHKYVMLKSHICIMALYGLNVFMTNAWMALNFLHFNEQKIRSDGFQWHF